MKYELLNKINDPADLRAVPERELPALSREIRDFLIEKTEKCGGHIASNLGVVELTLAIHRVFDSPKDHIIFDVGHQSYVHKLITGRRERFDTLRVPGGLGGFTSMAESEHDAFGAGHSSTSVSAALGYAQGDKLSGSDAYTVAVIGDGAYTGGMAHEALNNVDPDLKLIVILNENGMSISMNKGAFASYIAKVRISKGYVKLKAGTRSFLKKIPLIGKPLAAAVSFMKNSLKRIVYTTNYFEELGFYYIGPVDGNDYKTAERALREAKRLGKSVLIHVKTQKGKGYPLAENSPDEFHSVPQSNAAVNETYHSVFADTLMKEAEDDSAVVAVTAAMGIGTGLSEFGKKYPNRYFDVGIAEAHALTFSAGLAANSYKPFVAIYSTFLQRGYDSILHDIALQNLPVKMMIDRAGLATADGATHHGIFDVSFLSHIPNVTVLAPATYGTLRAAVADAIHCNTPIAIRYPNASESAAVASAFYPDGDYGNYGVRCDFNIDLPPNAVFLTYGKITETVLRAKELLLAQGIVSGVVLVEKIKPYSTLVDFISQKLSSVSHFIYVEEGIKNGGAAMITEAELSERGFLLGKTFDICAIDDSFAIPSSVCDIYDYLGLSAKKIAEKLTYRCKNC